VPGLEGTTAGFLRRPARRVFNIAEEPRGLPRGDGPFAGLNAACTRTFSKVR